MAPFGLDLCFDLSHRRVTCQVLGSRVLVTNYFSRIWHQRHNLTHAFSTWPFASSQYGWQPSIMSPCYQHNDTVYVYNEPVIRIDLSHVLSRWSMAPFVLLFSDVTSLNTFLYNTHWQQPAMQQTCFYSGKWLSDR